jgi:HK97 family phage major capsid protein
MTNELRNEYAALHTEAGKVVSSAAAEKRAITAEESEGQTKRYKRMDEIKAQDEAEKNHAKYAFEVGKVENLEPRGAAEFARSSSAISADKNSPEYIAEYRAALNHFLRTGEGNAKFTITSGTTALIPTQVLPPEVIRRNNNAFRALLAATGYSPIQTSDTATLSLPVFDDTAVSGDTPSQSATSDAVVDFATTGSITLGATLYSSKTRWFSNTLLNANGFDILSYVTPIIQKSVDKVQESAWTTNLTGITPAGTVTTASKAAITYSQIISFEHSLPVAYRSDAGFIVSDSAYQTMRGLVDNNGRPIFDLDPTNVFQAKLHGKAVVVSDYLSAIGTANGIAGAFVSGDAIKLRDVVPQRLTRYVNVPSQRDQTGYDLFANGDCQFVPSGVAFLKLAAT